jgi:hypothetical protein
MEQSIALMAEMKILTCASQGIFLVQGLRVRMANAFMYGLGNAMAKKIAKMKVMKKAANQIVNLKTATPCAKMKRNGLH